MVNRERRVDSILSAVRSRYEQLDGRDFWILFPSSKGEERKANFEWNNGANDALWVSFFFFWREEMRGVNFLFSGVGVFCVCFQTLLASIRLSVCVSIRLTLKAKRIFPNFRPELFFHFPYVCLLLLPLNMHEPGIEATYSFSFQWNKVTVKKQKAPNIHLWTERTRNHHPSLPPLLFLVRLFAFDFWTSARPSVRYPYVREKPFHLFFFAPEKEPTYAKLRQRSRQGKAAQFSPLPSKASFLPFFLIKGMWKVEGNK